MKRFLLAAAVLGMLSADAFAQKVRIYSGGSRNVGSRNYGSSIQRYGLNWRSRNTYRPSIYRSDYWRTGFRSRRGFVTGIGLPFYSRTYYGSPFLYPSCGLPPVYPVYPRPVYPLYQQPLYPVQYGLFDPVVPVFPANPVIGQALQENQLRWNGPLNLPPGAQPIVQGNRIPKAAASPDAVKRSLAFQLQGDEHFRKGDYLKAASRYESAISAAADRADPYFRHAYALIAVSQYARAVTSLKQGLLKNPHWPGNGISFAAMFGKDGELSKLAITQSVAAWVKLDIRDPDRLFLMGVLLHFDKPDKARPFLETAWRLSGSGEHLAAFLRAKPQQNNATKPLIMRGKQPAPGRPDENKPAPGPKLDLPK